MQTATFALGAVAGGALSDRLGRRRILLGSILLYLAGVGTLACATGPIALAAGVALSGAAIGGDLPTSLAMISEESPEGEKGRLVALTQAFWGAGIGATGLLAVCTSDMGAAAARILYVHLFVAAALVLSRRLDLRESREWVLAHASRCELACVPAPHSPQESVRRRRWSTMPTDATAVAAGALAIYYCSWNVVGNTLGQFRGFIWVNVLDGSPTGASLLVLLGVPLGIAGSLYFAAWADQPVRPRLIATGLALSATGLAVALAWPGRQAFAILVVCFVLGAALSGEAAVKVWSQELIPTLRRGAVTGVVIAFGRVGAALFAVVTPGLADRGLRPLAAVLLLALGVATVVALAWIPRLRAQDGRF